MEEGKGRRWVVVVAEMGWKRNYPALRLASSGVFPACPARELAVE
jgi:hypothetical protein